jgi:hypothetical protein
MTRKNLSLPFDDMQWRGARLSPEGAKIMAQVYILPPDIEEIVRRYEKEDRISREGGRGGLSRGKEGESGQ